jgi:hypothetical protein
VPANVDGMVREGIAAYRAGRKEEARTLLMRAVEIDQFNEQAWLWLSAVVETPDEQKTCLENVLTINPNNERARQGIKMLDETTLNAGMVNSREEEEDLLAGSSFSTSAAQSTGVPAGLLDDDDELPTDMSWSATPTATSSASSTQRVNEPSSQEYDDWVSQLNLGGSGGGTSSGGGSKNSLLDDAARAFSGPDPDEEADDGLDRLFSSGPFSDAEDMPAPAKPEPAKSATRSPMSSPSSPAASTPSKRTAVDPLLDDLDNLELDGGIFATGGSADRDEDDLFGDDDDDIFDDSSMRKVDADEMFRYIPKGIKATRLPGTREGYPIPVLIGLLVGILLNIGAVVLLIRNMTTG